MAYLCWRMEEDVCCVRLRSKQMRQYTKMDSMCIVSWRAKSNAAHIFIACPFEKWEDVFTRFLLFTFFKRNNIFNHRVPLLWCHPIFDREQVFSTFFFLMTWLWCGRDLFPSCEHLFRHTIEQIQKDSEHTCFLSFFLHHHHFSIPWYGRVTIASSSSLT